MGVLRPQLVSARIPSYASVATQPPTLVRLTACACMPTDVLAGGQDMTSTLHDVELLKQRLQPGVLVTHQHSHTYGHLDFELGSDAASLLYPTLLDLARQYAGMA